MLLRATFLLWRLCLCCCGKLQVASQLWKTWELWMLCGPWLPPSVRLFWYVSLVYYGWADSVCRIYPLSALLKSFQSGLFVVARYFFFTLWQTRLNCDRNGLPWYMIIPYLWNLFVTVCPRRRTWICWLPWLSISWYFFSLLSNRFHYHSPSQNRNLIFPKRKNPSKVFQFPIWLVRLNQLSRRLYYRSIVVRSFHSQHKLIVSTI